MPIQDYLQKIYDWLDPTHKEENLREDIAFMPDIEAAIRNSGARLAYLLSIITAVAILLFVIWSALAVLDEVTKADAQIIPSSKVQLIQSLDGGVVSEILVKEGAIVNKDEVLVRIDNVTAETSLKEKQARSYFLRGMIERLDAEINSKELVFSDTLKADAPEVITEQINQYNLRKNQTDAELSILESQMTQKNQEVREMQARLSQLRANLNLKQQELDIRKPLVAQGAMSKVELLRIEGEVTDLRGEINTISTAIPRANSAVGEAKQRIDETKAKKRAEAQNELTSAKSERDSLEQVLTAGEDKVKRTVMRSPVRGTIKQIKINTVGGVIKPGEDIMEIVPLGDTLLIEAKVLPKDIAFIRPGQKASVKITAYDSSVYGGLDGIVEGISADTIQNEKGESFYRVTIRTKETVMKHNDKELPIIPGMTANVQILTGRKSVLDYLLKPIMKARQEALRER
jgi:adhesin transport system membrane fusion protein